MCVLLASVLPRATAEALRGQYDRLMAQQDTARTEWDVVVIGAGVIGCSVAREVARRGAKTIVLDARTVGSGATQASARQ